MIFKIVENIWFDNEKLYLIKGKDNYYRYTMQYDNYNMVESENKKNRFPTIFFLSSTKCNLKCKYCYADEGTYRNVSNKFFFQLEDYIFIYEQAIEQFGGIHAISFFGGEPILNIDVIEKFVKYICNDKHKNKPILSIGSNAILMNEKIRKLLEEYHIHYSTSLDGPKKYNDQNRIGDGIESVYDKVTNTIKYISDLEIKKGIQITINKSHVENYKKNEIVSWINEIEQIGIDSYEIVPVTSDDLKFKIDLDNPDIFNKFVNLCEDYAEYELELLTSQKMPKAISNLIPSLLLHIMKREYQENCSAGFSFCVSPEKIAYPCHVCADNRIYGVKFDEQFRQKIVHHDKFQKVKHISKETMKECHECIAKKVCPYLCKGLCAQNGFKLPIERCVMIRIILEKVILFLAEYYLENKYYVKKNLVQISSRNIDV